MTATTHTSPPPPAPTAEKTLALALRLAHAEHALHAFTSGQVDAVVDPDGQVYLLRPAQEQARQNERRLQTVIDSVADVITIVDRGGVIISQSRALRRVLGYGPDEVEGRSLFDFVHFDDLPKTYSAFFNVVEGFQENSTVQFRHLAGDGSYRLIAATVGILRDASCSCVVFSFRPIASLQLESAEPAGPGALAMSPAGEDHELAPLSHQPQTPLGEALPATSSNQSTSAAGRTP